MSGAAEARLADTATEFWNRPSMAGRDGPVLNLLEHVKPLTAVETSKVIIGMKVTDLPNEILTSLPQYLECLDDWSAIIRTRRRFSHTCVNTRATFRAFFTRRYEHGCLPVHADLLMAGSARQVADWAVKSRQNRQDVFNAISFEGDEGLLKLGVEIARWRVEDARAFHMRRISRLSNRSARPLLRREEQHIDDIALHHGILMGHKPMMNTRANTV